MDQFEDRLRQTLRRRSSDVGPHPLNVGQVLRRSRVRRATVMATVFACVALVGIATAQSIYGPLREHDQSVAASPSSAGRYPHELGPISTHNHPGFECESHYSECVPFASGTRNEQSWTMYLAKFKPSRPEYEASVRWSFSVLWNGGINGGCSSPIATKVLTFRDSSGSTLEDRIAGCLSTAVARVEVRVKGYEPFEVPVVPGPRVDAAEETEANYFIAFVPTHATVEVAVFDSSGRELEVRKVPQDPSD